MQTPPKREPLKQIFTDDNGMLIRNTMDDSPSAKLTDGVELESAKRKIRKGLVFDDAIFHLGHIRKLTSEREVNDYLSYLSKDVQDMMYKLKGFQDDTINMYFDP